VLKKKIEGVISTLQEIAQEVESEKEEKTVLDSTGKALTPWRSVLQYRDGLDRFLYIGIGLMGIIRVSLAAGYRGSGCSPNQYTERFLFAPEIAELFRQKYERRS